ncbi:hypothetical protein [Saccharospirillum impatiens]|uniref:hypothetical protein n=1 Tax=Saccharospirillum impatiens TaxID=169438 RepID=UPI0004914D8F|nr:hypothetical protein [Saccharospirillum impatiens]
MHQIVEIDLEPSSGVNPLKANAQVIDWLFNESTFCLALDFNLSVTSKIRNDHRPRLTTKLSYHRDRLLLLRSSMKGFLSCTICDQEVEVVKSMYIDGFPGYFVSEFYSEPYSLPIEESIVDYVIEFSSVFDFEKTLLFHAHDGYPVFMWKIDSQGNADTHRNRL